MRFIHVVCVTVVHSACCLTVEIHHHLFICLTADRYLDFLQFEAITNSATMDMCGVNLLGMELEVEMLGPTVHMYSALVGIAKQIPKTIVPVYSSPRSESVNCSTFLPTLKMLILAIMVSMLRYFYVV